MIEPARFTQALRAWAGGRPRARIRRRDRGASTAATGPDWKPPASWTSSLFAWRALDALRADPRAGGRPRCSSTASTTSPRSELDALEVLSRHAGRRRSRSRFRTSRGARRSARPPPCARSWRRSRTGWSTSSRPPTTTRPGSRRRCTHSSATSSSPTPARRSPARAIRLHTAGGERAEIELCGAEVLRLLREGTPPGEVAVVLREPADYASTVEQIFGAYGIPYSIDRSVTLAHTSLGRGLLALLRCACLDGSGRRPPGLPAHARLPHAAWTRRPARGGRAPRRHRHGGAGAGAVGGGGARRSRSMRSTASRPPPASRRLLEQLARCLGRSFRAPYRRTAPHARGRRAGRRARLPRRPRRDRGAAAPWSTPALRSRRSTPAGPRRARGRCACAWARTPSPTASRWPRPRPSARGASRPCSCAACRRASSPAASAPEAFLPDADRRAIAIASGLRLPTARGASRARALPLLRLRLPRRARARAELALLRRGGQPAGALVLRGRRAGHLPGARASASAGARSRRSRGSRRRRPPRPSGSARWRCGAPAACPPPSTTLSSEAARAVLAARSVVSAGRAREVRRLPGALARRGRAAPGAARARLRADGARPARAPRARAHLQRGCASAPATAAVTPGNLAQAEEIMREAIDERARPLPRGRHRLARAARPSDGWSTTCSRRCATRRSRAGRLRARAPRAALRPRRRAATRPSSSPRGVERARHDRPGRRVGPLRAGARLQERQGRQLQGGQLGARAAAPGAALHARGGEAAGARGGRRHLHARCGAPIAARAACWPPRSPSRPARACTRATAATPTQFEAGMRAGSGRHRRGGGRHARRSAGVVPGLVRLRAAAASTRRSAGSEG